LDAFDVVNVNGLHVEYPCCPYQKLRRKGKPSDGVHRWTNTRPRHLERAVFATFRTIAVPSGNTIGSDAEWRYAVSGAERDRQAARRS
jgi:hypothetical protein